MLEAAGLPAGAEAQRAIKYDIVDTVGRDASAVLLDPDVSVTEIVERGALGCWSGSRPTASTPSAGCAARG